MFRIGPGALALIILGTGAGVVFAQTLIDATFTYQGQLKLDGTAVTNDCTFEFSLWDDPTAGSQIGTTQYIYDHPVVDGLFSVFLNAAGEFGAAPFDGQARWLEITVTVGEGSPVTLSPRQPVTSTPYAVYGQTAPWSGLLEMPVGFADGVDDDTTYSAGTGLLYEPSESQFSLDPLYMLPQACADGQVAKWDEAGGVWLCAGDDVGSAEFWSLTGNGGTDPVVNFLGTTDDVVLELRVNSQRALRIEPTLSATPNLIGGHSDNNATAGVAGAAISGGGDSGYPNRVTDSHGTVSGGGNNQAGDDDADPQNKNAATVGGGWSNTASGQYSTVAGGRGNIAGGWYSAVGGGWVNYADAEFTTIAGGGPSDPNNPTTTNNAVYDKYGTIGGGANNRVGSDDGDPATATCATVGGGAVNVANAQNATVGGGAGNNANGVSAVVAGGNDNIASGGGASVGGGALNTATGDYATVAGGFGHTASGVRSVVAGGAVNQAAGDYAAVGGGYYCHATGAFAVVGGGGGWNLEVDGNTAAGDSSTVAGGRQNLAAEPGATVSGGAYNTASGYNATVGGGDSNGATGGAATVPGGTRNLATGGYSFAAGRRAKANHDGTFVWGDSTDADFASSAPNQFLIRAGGGVGIGVSDPWATLHVAGSIMARSGAGCVISPQADCVELGYMSPTMGGYTALRLLEPGYVTFPTAFVGIGTDTPASPLCVNGLVESLTGGFKFPDGTVQTTAATGGGFWAADGNDIYNTNTGGVGIGTNDPNCPLHVIGDYTGGYGTITGVNTDAYGSPGLYGQNTDASNGLGVKGVGSRAGVHGLVSSTNFNTHTGVLGEAYGGTGSNVGVSGIGWNNADTNYGVRGEAYGGTENYGGYLVAGGEDGVGVYGEAYYSGSGVTYGGHFISSSESGRGLYANATGSIGRGVVAEANGTYGIGVYAEGGDTGVLAKATGAVGVGIVAEAGPSGGWAGEFRGNVKILDPNTLSTVIELGTGLDYAEGFDVSNADQASPGMVVIIDPDNPGKLALSTQPYDRKVAGIVAGAKGLGSAVRLGPGQFDLDVALAGRVYCNVDTTYGAIEPGDLLTTSPTPGYAMKVSDYTKAQGAILGKAMEKLEAGKHGQILVLVTLQ